VSPDRTALAAGGSGLISAASAAVTRALVVGRVPGTPSDAPAPFTPATLVLAAVSMIGFLLGVLAIWSAIKAWLRDDFLNPRARLGLALGVGAMLIVVATGPCGPQGCPG
jgi:uncharacterized membrane protein